MLVCAIALIASSLLLAPPSRAQVPLKLVELASGLDSPSYATTFPENEELLVVAEKAAARISCIPLDQIQAPHLVLDLASSLGAYLAGANEFVAPDRVDHTTDLGVNLPTADPLFESFDNRLISSTWEGEILLTQVEAIGSSLGSGTVYKVVPG